MDKRFLEKYMPHLASHLHYRNVDVSTVKEFTRRWYPDQYEEAPKRRVGTRPLGTYWTALRS